MTSRLIHIVTAASLGLLLLFSSICHPVLANDIQYTSSDDQDFSIRRFVADGRFLALWLAPEYGFTDSHRSMARHMARQGIEVWQVDLVEDLFLPPGTSALKQLEGHYVAELITHAFHLTGKKIVVAGDSYAAAIALRGARQWQLRSPPQPYLVGAVLFSPYAYAYIPPLGLKPTYLPIVEATNLPLAIIQASDSATAGEFDTLLEKLGEHDSPVYIHKVADVMSLFYQDPPTEIMVSSSAAVARQIRRLLPLLAQHSYPAQAATTTKAVGNKSGIDLYLREFIGNASPGAIRLPAMDAALIERRHFSGKVTLVNFWATWCPPCVEEIPALNRLARHFDGKPFELISINYAQDRDTVSAFMQQVAVDYPVLLDADGSFAKSWNVISFPSTFVIDAEGHFRYGVNAVIDWDSPELIRRLEALLP